MTTTNTRRGARWRDRQSQIGGQVLAMCGDAQKAIALAMDRSEGWVSRLVNGHPAAGAYLRLIARIEEFRSTEAAPLAVAPLAELYRKRAECWTGDELEDAEAELLELEGTREAEENAAALKLLLAHRGAAPAQEVHQLERRLAAALVGSLAAQAVLLGTLWERDRRRVEAGESVH